jgi:hypothetical protein
MQIVWRQLSQEDFDEEQADGSKPHINSYPRKRKHQEQDKSRSEKKDIAVPHGEWILTITNSVFLFPENVLHLDCCR